MGITIAYRGRLADLTRIDEFEHRLSDYAREIGAQARVWRSRPDDNPERVVRGVILGLAPGHESTSLLVSPEGWLIGLTISKMPKTADSANRPGALSKPNSAQSKAMWRSLRCSQPSSANTCPIWKCLMKGAIGRRATLPA
jgi:hypothetical protein